MIKKRVLEPTRVRRVNGSFSFIPHRFLSDGFWASLNHHELVLYLFLVLASDKKGLSYYSSKRICSLLVPIYSNQIMFAKDFSYSHSGQNDTFL